MNFVGLGVTLVLANLVFMGIMTVGGMYLMKSKWFMKWSYNYAKEITKNMMDEMEEIFKDEEL